MTRKPDEVLCVVIVGRNNHGINRIEATIGTPADGTPRGLGSDDPRNYIICSAYVGGSLMDGRPECEVWGWSIHADEIGHAEAGKLEAIAKVLRSIEKKMDAMAQKLGRPESFGQYVNRFGLALGATKSVRYLKSPRHDGTRVSGMMAVSDCAWLVDSTRREYFPTTAERASLADNAA